MSTLNETLIAGLPVPDVINRQSQEEYGQVAVPEARKHVVQFALVGLGFILVLFANDKDVLAQKISAASKTDK